MLHRQPFKPEGNTWCLPGGKKDSHERDRDAVEREIWEETGLLIHEGFITHVATVFVRYPKFDFRYAIFHAKLFTQRVTIRKSEHQSFCWIAPEQVHTLNLIEDEGACIALACSHKF